VGPEEGGVREVVGDAGTLVRDRTARGYADALRRYLDDEQLALEVGRRGRHRAEERFSFVGMVARMAAVYDEVTEGHASGRSA